MYAYCRNNPVCRIDIAGTVDADCVDEDGRPLSSEDIENLSGGGGSASTSGNSTGSTLGSTDVPQHAWDTLNYVKTHNGSPPQGYKGGGTYSNDGRGGSQILPSDEGPFREYDVHPKVIGVDRGRERIVIGGSGSAWYTSDHYIAFTRME